MFAMFQQLFSAIAMFFASFEKLGGAANHLATWAEESAGSFADEARVQRQAKLDALEAKRTAQQKQIAHDAATTA